MEYVAQEFGYMNARSIDVKGNMNAVSNDVEITQKELDVTRGTEFASLDVSRFDCAFCGSCAAYAHITSNLEQVNESA